MSKQDSRSRRLFFRHAGAALAVPLTVVAAEASAAPRAPSSELEARLAALGDESAIRALNQAYARFVNDRLYPEVSALYADPVNANVDRSVSRLSAESFGEHDTIDVAQDRATAEARLHCVVETETPLEPGSTLVDMARQQGEGFVHRTERRVLEHSYVKLAGVWKIARSTFRSA
jgi:hypothetical protein